LKGLVGSLNGAEEGLVAFILRDPAEAVSFTMTNLAAEAGVSYATVSRFCKRLGYAGFKEFKQAVVADLSSQAVAPAPPDELPLTKSTPVAQVCRSVYAFSKRVLEESGAILEPERVEAAVKALAAARRVILIGAGTSAISARYAHSRFFRLGLNCSAEEDAVFQAMQVSMVGKGEVVFAISSSGRTNQVVDAARQARKHGATVISLTDYAVSPLTKAADISLFTTPRNVSQHREIERPLLIGQIALIDTLFTCLSIRLPRAARATYDETHRAADRGKG
jgi:DNA-binding MurR/RpiR family transcriptional regulator